MASTDTIMSFLSRIQEEVALAKDADVSGWSDDDFLTAVILDYIEEAGECDDPIMCPYRDRGVQLNAYVFSEDFDILNLFVTVYSDAEKPRTVPKSEVEAAMKRAVQVYHKASNDLYKSFDKDCDVYEFAVTVKDRRDSLKEVRIGVLTNGLVTPAVLNSIEIDGVSISFTVWDLDRLFRCATSGKMRETIEIDFVEKFGSAIPCIENASCAKYSVYLAIIRGDILAALYAEHRDRLLEKNVRSFLQVKGAVNKGIRNTLREEPEMFLAYNNGISVTAESVGIVRDNNGKPSISNIRDMQIVNGGQTTASIYNAMIDRKAEIKLDQVFVQMKISAIRSIEDADEMVPKISTFANTQNKVQIADFSANDPFHRRIEELSRTIWAPAQNGEKPRNWFYERARGQYTDRLAQESTTKRRKEFKESHPLFTKTDLAKFENTWDQLPYFVSEGAQKNFRRFMLRLEERRGILPDEVYYQRLVAKAILFKTAEKLVSKQQYGGYRANIVTYTLALLSHRSAQRLDLDKLWREQSLSSALEAEIVAASAYVQKIVVNPPNGANVSEWCKKEKCWDFVRDCGYEMSEELRRELVSVSRSSTVKPAPVNSIDSLKDEEVALIEEAAAVSAETWFALSKWAKETGNFQPWQRSLLFSLGSLASKGNKPSIKQATQVMKVYKAAFEKGFVSPSGR